MGNSYRSMINREAAIDIILEERQKMLSNQKTRNIPVDKLDSHFLADSIAAGHTSPACDQATMDGFALDANEEYPLSIREKEMFPEQDQMSINPGEAVPITTGAPLPDGANAVLKKEDASVDQNTLYGKDIAPGTYTYTQGTNFTAGETIFEPGEHLSPKDAILLKDLGYDTVPVFQELSVSILATGTEISDGKKRDLNSDMLSGLVQMWGHNPTYKGSVSDDYEQLEKKIIQIADKCDVLLTTGGTSVGKKDFVVQVLDSLGEVHFHYVQIRPGKPIAMAYLPDYDTTVFAIPGKPIGAHTAVTLIARPFFTGERTDTSIKGTLERTVNVTSGNFEYVIPVMISKKQQEYTAKPLGHVDSPLSIYDRQFDPSVLSASTRASRADGVVITESSLNAGEEATIIPYSSLKHQLQSVE